MQEQLNPKKLHQEMQAIRKTGLDTTLTQHLASNYGGMTIDQYYSELQVNPLTDTVQLILDRQDEASRWLVPELIRDAIRKGYINQPITNDLIIREESIAQPSQVMPYWDMTGLPNAPKTLGVAESMELGSIKYGQKTVRVTKSGIGLELADECIRYTNLSMLAIWLADVGVKLGSALGVQAINCLINGEQSDSSEAAATIGVASAGTLAFGDLIKPWVRGALLNRKWTRVVGNEAMINTMLNMAEFRNTDKFGNSELGLNLKTPVPRALDAYCHSSVPTNKLIMVDPNFAMIRLTAVPLQVESERIVQRQINGTYVSLTTGFAIVFRDGRIILDKSVTTDFPAWMAPLF